MRHTRHYNLGCFAVVLMIFSLFPAELFAEEDSIDKSIAKCEAMYLQQDENSYETCVVLADKGHARAQKIIGDMHYFSWGKQIPKNYIEARRWYKRAATKGDVDAKFAVGNLYYEGLGTDINYSMAFRWFISAANDGNAQARFNLANMYAKGAGVSVDDAEAFKWYLKAAEAGMAEAQYNAANRYAKGKGVRANLSEAYFWYLLAEKNGIAQAKNVAELVADQLDSLEASKVRSKVDAYKIKK